MGVTNQLVTEGAPLCRVGDKMSFLSVERPVLGWGVTSKTTKVTKNPRNAEMPVSLVQYDFGTPKISMAISGT